LRDAAGVTGQTFYVDFNKAIQFRVTSNDTAPIDFDTSTVETATLTIDRETYRNVQTVIVTGTPASESSTDANVSTQVRQNNNQIAARAAIEGGSGRYENIEEVTHPTSNAGADLALLGIGYANLRLATSGTPRQTLACRARNYGFRAGQFATATLASLGVSGTWLIQKVSVREEDGRKLVHDLELVQSSLQYRAYESWLNIVKGGKITVQMPGSVTSNSVTYTTTPGSPWTVPAGVTSITITCVGASGGGGGGNTLYSGISGCYSAAEANGGAGGPGGLAISIVTVTEGQEVDLVVGTAGLAGDHGSFSRTCFATDPTSGTSATVTTASISGTLYCQANGGTFGRYGYYHLDPAFDGSAGSGVGDAVTVGGGKAGGTGGISGGAVAGAGSDGSITIEW